MKILVAMKQVPESGSPFRIDASGRWIDEADLNYTLNESDAYALEQALQLKGLHGGEVVALSVGPDRVQAVLRDALAKGADRALHVRCAEEPGRDALGTARLLAAAIRPESPDLVLSGLQSDDVGHGQTGVLLAELLGLPHASLILQVEKSATGLSVKHELEEGWLQMIEMPIPAVLAIQSGGSKLRYANLMGIKHAKTKEMRVIEAGELGVDLAPAVVLDHVSAIRRQKSTQFLQGTPTQAAAELVHKLKFEARVL